MISDEKLVARAQQGDPLATDVLVRRYIGMAYSIARSYHSRASDRDDIRQEAVSELLRAIHYYRADRGLAFSSFAANCIRLGMVTMLRRDHSRKHEMLNQAQSLDVAVEGEFGDLDLHEAIPDPRDGDPAVLVERTEDVAAVVRVLTVGLSRHQRAVAVGLMNGETYLEIATRLGISEKSVDNAIQHARHKVLRALGEAA